MAHVIGCNDPVTQCQYCKGVLIDEVKVSKCRTKKIMLRKMRRVSTSGFVDFAKKRTEASRCILSPIITSSPSKKNVLTI